LTLVDLFATQALLPTLTRHYAVSPAAMGVAVNACTFGMALSSLVVAFISRRIDRRRGIFLSLALLAIPTALLSVAPNLEIFAVLRVAQGLFMAAAFALMLAYLGERYSAQKSVGVFAAYVTGNVASNLFGRMFAAAIADHLGLSAAFYTFALLNLAGAALVYVTIARTKPMVMAPRTTRDQLAAWADLLRDRGLRASFGIGFCILFAFIGTFTYVNFVLAAAPFELGMMSLGFVYLVFAPSIVTTPLGGKFAARFGTRATLWGALAIAGAAIPLLLASTLTAVLAGLALMGVGTFLAQAVATGFIGQAAGSDRGSASGLYLASYFLGGLVGSFVLGQLFVRFGWIGCVAGIGAALGLAALLTAQLHMPRRHRTDTNSAISPAGPMRDPASQQIA
jgi:predicted MFS family arabinose efflux permease